MHVTLHAVDVILVHSDKDSRLPLSLLLVKKVYCKIPEGSAELQGRLAICKRQTGNP